MKSLKPPSFVVWGIRAAGIIALCNGAFWLAAWFAGWAARWPAPGMITPKTNMALCQLLGGAALLLLGSSSRAKPWRAVVSMLALVVMFAGALTFGEHVYSHDLRIDQLLATEAPGAAGTASPNRMGPFGSFSLALIGAGFLAFVWGRRRLASYLGLAVCVISLVPAVGFLYGAAELYSLPALTGVAWPTVIALLALGFGLMLAAYDRGPMALVMSPSAGGVLLRKMLPAAILVPLALGFLHVFGRSRGFFDAAMGAGLLVIAMILIFSRFLWQSSATLSRSTAAESEALRALRASEGRLKRAQQIADVGSWEWDIATGPVYWSEQVFRQMGEQPGRFEPTDDIFRRRIHPEDRAAVDSAIDLALAGIAPYDLEFRIVRPDKVVRVLHSRAEIVRDLDGRPLRMAGVSMDITERKRAEDLSRALVEQEKLRLGAAVEQASDAVVMVDLDGTIRYVNAAFEAINRLPRLKAVGLTYFDLVDDDPGSARAIREAVAHGEAWHGPLTRLVPEGRPVELEVTISPAKDPSGAIVGGLVTEKDVTQENALQRQVRQAQKMEALGTLAGGITHDFNNILGAIVINTELALLDMDPADPARRTLPLVLQAANRGKELVKQIITFSRQRAWERSPVEIVPIVMEGTIFLRSTLPKDVTIRETIDARGGIVMADPSHIHQIMVNLCQNAVLAMRNGGGMLDVKLESVEIDRATTVLNPDLKPGPYVRLTIADTGCGISSEIMDRIFEPFFTTRGPGGGSGLGLAVVHGIVKTYNGAITVRSEPGKGSTFEVYLPRLEGDALAREIGKPFEPVRGKERILFVEDEPAQRLSLTRALEALGYKVTVDVDGPSALSTFRKDPGAFDVVITDQIMPGMTGLELAPEIAALRADIPIILCTGFSEQVNSGVVGRNGVRELIMKPFTIHEISRLVQKVAGPGTRSAS